MSKRILVVEDQEDNRQILRDLLASADYEMDEAENGEEALAAVAKQRPDLILMDIQLPIMDGDEALAAAKEQLPDLILLDIMMPKIDGIEVCKRIKNDATMPFTPIILCTAKADSKDVVAGLEAGADEYLTKPIDQLALVARVKSVLRLKELHDRVLAQAADLASWNRELEERVAAQVCELEQVGRLKRFLAPQIAEAIV